MHPVIREANYSDCEAVGALKVRNGLAVQWSTDRWVGLWQDNPAMEAELRFPIGWVLEQAGKIVGYLGNIPLHYRFQGKRLLAAAACGFVVDAEHRGHSLRLAAAFFSQKTADLLLNTSANVPAASVFQLCKAEKIPHADYDKALFWVVNAKGFVRSVLRKLGYGVALSSVGGTALAPVIHLESLLRQRGPFEGRGGYDMSILEPNTLGAEFDELWQRTLPGRSSCLLADRSSGVLRWHFGHCAAGMRQAKFVCAWRMGKLVGYVALTRENSQDIGLTRSRISDLLTEDDDPDLLDSLLWAAFHQARSDGSYILEVIGFPQRIRASFAKGHAYVRHLPSWQFWYKAVSRELSDSLKNENAWYGSSYDGDASL